MTPSLPEHAAAPCRTFFFCLLANGFAIDNSDVTHVLSLVGDLPSRYQGRCRTAIKKAERLGVTVQSRAPAADFWRVMDLTFDRHGTRPTHDRAQWAWLCEHLPGEVYHDVAYLDGRPVAAIGHVRINARVGSSFYLASDPEARDSQALTLLIHRHLQGLQQEGLQWFEFGTSSVEMAPRPNLFRFKESFGAVGSLRHRLVWTP